MRPSCHTTFSYSANADPLRHAAFDLPRREHRIDHLAHFLHRDEIVHAHFGSAHVHGHLGHVNRPGVRAVSVALVYFSIVPVQSRGCSYFTKDFSGPCFVDVRARRLREKSVALYPCCSNPLSTAMSSANRAPPFPPACPRSCTCAKPPLARCSARSPYRAARFRSARSRCRSASAAICAKIVFVPWPISVLASQHAHACRPPVASIATSDARYSSPEPVNPAPWKKRREANPLLDHARESEFRRCEAFALGVVIAQFERAVHQPVHIHFFADHLADRHASRPGG